MRRAIQFTIKAIAVSSVALAAVAAAGGAQAATPAGVWGKAQELPGMGALNTGGGAYMNSVSCSSAGNCGAGGFYKDGSGHIQAAAASQAQGTWRKAIEIAGTAALNTGGNAQIFAVSCSSVGSCGAGGSYTDSSGHSMPFVVSEKNGAWRTAIAVPGVAALNHNGSAPLIPLSCRSAGNCTAAGDYTDGSGNHQVFVVSEMNGAWGTAIEAPGIAALNTGGGAYVDSGSCASAGNCSVGGEYRDGSGHFEAFVIDQVNGTWQTAIEVPGVAALNVFDVAYIVRLSCPSAGNCSAGGAYVDVSDHVQQFVVSEKNGTWGNAEAVPGLVALNKGGWTYMSGLSCPSAGNCGAGGVYTDGSGHQQAFIVNQVNGTWHKAVKVPGTATLNKGGGAQTLSVSCPSAGNCSIGGYYTSGSGQKQAFVASEVNGTWHTAIEVPGTATLNKGGQAQITSVSCTSPGECTATGQYTDAAHHGQVFVVTES